MSGRLRKLSWFGAIWALSVAALGALALAIRLIISPLPGADAGSARPGQPVSCSLDDIAPEEGPDPEKPAALIPSDVATCGNPGL
jgi:hypothetical protein